MTTTRSQAVANDVAVLLRARNPVLWVVTREEARVERFLIAAAKAATFVSRTWDTAQGVADQGGTPQPSIASPDPGEILRVIGERSRSRSSDRCVWILRDFAPWVSGTLGITGQRQLRNLARQLPGAPLDQAQAIVILTPISEIPAELADHVTVIEWPMPDRDEIAGILDAALNAIADEAIRKAAAPNGTREAAIDAAVGLSGEEAAACYASSLVKQRKIDPAAVAREKKKVIARERVLEWYDPLPGGLASVGGLDLLKAWLTGRASAYTKEARAYGLPAPRGSLLVGVSGCGKSLTAKAIATAWGVPLLRLDLGALKSKFVGESEQNLRKAFQVIESVGRCVVWLDEAEKALAGATQGAADGGVSADALGAILSWMQERQGEAFVIATANDISGLPPEFLRKGRFDEIWFVDLPTQEERIGVLTAALTVHGRRDAISFDGLRRVAESTRDFTGAELAALVPDALYAAFADEARQITESDLLDAAATVVPLAKTAESKIKALRDWAQGRARRASRDERSASDQSPEGRRIDL